MLFPLETSTYSQFGAQDLEVSFTTEVIKGSVFTLYTTGLLRAGKELKGIKVFSLGGI